ncbi:MAG: serine protease [Proteobacteria bacterium]|nr:MAG: serine protease [Pseudomonadota bacterium]
MNELPSLTETLPLAAARVWTFHGLQFLTGASGFFFERAEKLYLVSSLHVFIDEAIGHFPDRVEIELHVDPGDLAVSTGFSIPLYRNGAAAWKQGVDRAGPVDVAMIEIERSALPAHTVYRAFNPGHLPDRFDHVALGASLLVIGFPLGFHDTLHHMPVARQAVVATTYGLRFKGEGYFLTDARTHRGTSGAPVVMRLADPTPSHGDLPWMLLGIHSARLDVGTRDIDLDEALGLNCAWYPDILMTLST